MPQIFIEILNMSIAASYLILAVALLRVPLKKAPKWISVLLFGIAAIRLICPFSIESVLSLIPSANTVSPDIMVTPNPEINSGIPFIDNTINPVITDTFKPEIGASVNPLQLAVGFASYIWLVGIAILVAHAIISYFKIKRRVRFAVRIRDNIYASEGVTSPFVLGIINPRIYIPYNMDSRDEEYVIAHEMAHIRRRDYIWKPLGYAILTLHWFNPVVWLGYILLCRDIEGACDEKVIKELGHEERASYSEALLSCSANRRIITACPLAFGEQGVKGRIKSVLNYKKPAFWIIIVALIASVVLSVVFLTDPVKESENVYLKEVNLLYAGEGDFSEYEFRNSVNRYTGTCENLEWSSGDGIYIKTDYKVVSATVRIFSPGALEDYSTTAPDKYFVQPTVEDNNILIDIGWFYRASEDVQRSNQWSYLVTVTEENNTIHNYYFRVDYDISVIDSAGVADSVVYDVFSTAVYDIESGGNHEICELTYNNHGDSITELFIVRAYGKNEAKYEADITSLPGVKLLTKSSDGTLRICCCLTSSRIPFSFAMYDVSIKNGEVVITPAPKGTKMEFKADLYLQGVGLNWTYSMNVSVDDDTIYLNNWVYDKISYVENFDIRYNEATIMAAQTKGYIEVLEKLKNAPGCYIIETDQENPKFGQKLAIYKFDNRYYFVNFYENGDVVRIHSAKIP